jgi:hypothetical protein
MSSDKFSNLFWNNLKTSDITNDPNQPQQGLGGTPEQPAIPGSQTPGALPANPLEGGGIDPITGQPAIPGLSEVADISKAIAPLIPKKVTVSPTFNFGPKQQPPASTPAAAFTRTAAATAPTTTTTTTAAH